MGNSYNDQNKWNRKNQGGQDDYYNGPTSGEKKKTHREERRAQDDYLKNIKKNGYDSPEEDDDDYDPFEYYDEEYDDR